MRKQVQHGHRRDQALSSPGFTLLEVMVAIAITGLCVALVSLSFGAVFRAHRRATEHLELQQTRNMALERMRLLLQAAYISPYFQNQTHTPFESMDYDNVAEPYDAITFTTLAHSTHRIDAKEADLAEITLFTEEEAPLDSAEGRLRLHRLRVRVGGEINDRFEVDGGMAYTLADHVTMFLIEYLDPEGEWRPEWFPGDRGNSLPCALRITLGLRTQGLEEVVSTMIVPMEMTSLRCRFEEETVFELQ